MPLASHVPSALVANTEKVNADLRGLACRLIMLIAPIFLISCQIVAVARAEVLVSGITADCIAGRYWRPAGVDVHIFNAATSPQLVKLAKETERLNTLLKDPPLDETQKRVDEFMRAYTRLKQMARTSKPLARTKSRTGGRFTARIAGMATGLIVPGFLDSEGEPYYYAIALADARAQSRVSVVLDFFGEDCAESYKKALDELHKIRKQ